MFGNRITLGALLLDEALDEDPIARYTFCSRKCSLCVEECPGKALDGSKVIQKNCREKSIITTLKVILWKLAMPAGAIAPVEGE